MIAQMFASIRIQQTGMIADNALSFFQAAPKRVGDAGIHQGRMLQNVQLRDIPIEGPSQHVQHYPIGTEHTACGLHDNNAKWGTVTQKPIPFIGGSKCIFGPAASLFQFLDSEEQLVAFAWLLD
jgi:hypothetical protein